MEGDLLKLGQKSKGKFILVKLDNNGFQFFDPVKSRSYSFSAVPDGIRDGEITNLGVLEVKLKTFLAENKISSTSLFFILSKNIIFEKDFLPNVVDLEGEIKKYAECVPYENYAYKTYSVDNNLKLVVFNQDYLEGTQNIFSNNGFVTIAAIPYFLVNKDGNNPDELNQITVSFITKNYDTLIKEDVLAQNLAINSRENVKSKPTQRYELIALLFIFMALIVLAAMFLIQQNKSAVPKKTINQLRIIPTLVPSPTSIAASASGVLNSQNTVRIEAYKEVMPLAQRMQTELVQAGFLNTQIDNLATASAQRSTVIFSSATPTVNRNIITALIKQELDDFLVEESTSVKFDTLIILGK